MIIAMLYRGRILNEYKIVESLTVDERYRILVNDYVYNKRNVSVIAGDGESERIFASKFEALQFIMNLATNHISLGYVDGIIVE